MKYAAVGDRICWDTGEGVARGTVVCREVEADGHVTLRVETNDLMLWIIDEHKALPIEDAEALAATYVW